jgi:transcriptional regulator with XRE-family HTH domain
MIKTQREYEEALKRIKHNREVAALQRQKLEEADLSPEEVALAMEPLLSFHAQLIEEVRWYENVRARNFETLSRLTDLGRLLIALRIANGLTQRDLAERLGVSETQVSRDERNDYHGITLERAQRILEALHESVSTTVQKRHVGEAAASIEDIEQPAMADLHQHASATRRVLRVDPRRRYAIDVATPSGKVLSARLQQSARSFFSESPHVCAAGGHQ